ncbi:MAG: Leu/Phe/Val dehydrogenase [Bradymonadaceae bacterium]
MDLFEYAEELQYGDLHVRTDPATGLRAIIAVHNLQLGPAIGGCRFNTYETTDDAIRDAMRLARGMTYKAAITGLPHGGAKAVLMRPPELSDENRRELFEAFGDFVDSLGGDYITAEDVGTNVADMDVVADRTDHVLGVGEEHGGGGDPSPFTATGVRRGIEAAVDHRWDRGHLDGLRVAVQGLGSVGYELANQLVDRGAELVVTDVDEDRLARAEDELGATTVESDAIFDVDCEVFSPCALGAVLDDETIPRLKADIVAGAANNQLAEGRHGRMLVERDILYAPDYVINAGGLIHVAENYAGYEADRARERIEGIYDSLTEIFERADEVEAPTGYVADRIVEEKLV